MLTKIDNTIKYGKQHNGFGVQILYPGLIRPQANDTGLFSLGRIDHARINPGTRIPMHPHRNDEIVTYLRRGEVKHLDSEGYMAVVSAQQVMVMNAGTEFFHEEKVQDEGAAVEGLQLFIRPEKAGLQPMVQFYQLPEKYSSNQWRKFAGKGDDYPLQLRSHTWLMDARLEKGNEIILPKPPVDHCAFLFYVFEGNILANNQIMITTGESMLIENDSPKFCAIEASDIVLFIMRTDLDHYGGGLYSGNLH